jgi:putative transposase
MLYNTAKQQRELAYKPFGTSIFYSMQQKELPVLKREFPEYKEVHSQVLQDCLQRLDDLISAFFARKPGIPVTNPKTDILPLPTRNRVR